MSLTTTDSPINYRQAGTPRHGRLRRGEPPVMRMTTMRMTMNGSGVPSSRHHHHIDEPMISSIPSRYETILTGHHRNGSGSIAFSSGSQRFTYGQMATCPGPGQYNLSSSPVISSTSLSRKGYGCGFISKAIRSSLIGSSCHGSIPGPGSYNIDRPTSFTEDNRRRQFNRIGNVLFRSTRRFTDRIEMLPGPGDYTTGETIGCHAIMGSFSRAPRSTTPSSSRPDIPLSDRDPAPPTSSPNPSPLRPSPMFMGGNTRPRHIEQYPGPQSYTIEKRFGADAYGRGSIGFSSMFGSTHANRGPRSDKERQSAVESAIAAQNHHARAKRQDHCIAYRSANPRQMKAMARHRNGVDCETSSFRVGRSSGDEINETPGPASYDIQPNSVKKKSFRSRRIQEWVGK